MLDGCSDWQEHRLSPPKAVADATSAYLDAEDALAAWVEEACDKSPDAWASATTLFGSWTEWATQAGEFVGTQRRFTQALEAHGFQPHRKTNGRGFYGLAIRPSMTGLTYAKRLD